MSRTTLACGLLAFVFLFRLIYSALHQYMKLARYNTFGCTHTHDINRVFSFINGNMKFIGNFVSGIGQYICAILSRNIIYYTEY